MVRIDKFKQKEQHIPFESAYKALCELLGAQSSSRFGYSVLETDIPNVLIARQEHDPYIFQYEKANKKWEGLMYRDGDACYQFKRTKSLLKIKDMQDSEFKICAMLEGTGKNSDRLGALLVHFKDGYVGVGSGFKDDDRKILWDNKKIFLSKKFVEDFSVKVQYFEETTDADGNPSLRFPVFLCFRHNITKEEFTPSQVLDWCREGAK